MSELGIFIKKYRESHEKMSIRELATRCDLSPGYIHKLEKGVDPRTQKPIIPTVDTINKLSRGMGINASELLALSGLDISSEQIYASHRDTRKTYSSFNKSDYKTFIEDIKVHFMEADPEDKDALFRDISDIYFESKQINKKKYHLKKNNL